MAITYTEIEHQKNSRIWVFFAITLLFYFAIALLLLILAKLFFLSSYKTGQISGSFITGKQILLTILFASVAAVLHVMYSMSNALSFIKKNLEARTVDETDRYHRRFNNILDELRVATGSRYDITPMVLPTAALNAFAIAGRGRKAIVGVTEGLLCKLNRQQLQAVVAHEVAHVASGDSLQTTIGCSLFGIYVAMLSGIRTMLRGGGRVRYNRSSGSIFIFLIFVYLGLSITQFFYKIVRMFVSRDRELRADAIAVRLTRDPLSLSEALYIISRGWRGIGSIDSNLESIFIVNTQKAATDEKGGFWANMMSTHPPIKKRVEILADMAHADVGNLKERVESNQKLKESMRDIPKEEPAKDSWMLMDRHSAWKGPFTMPQIMLLNWVSPATRIMTLGSADIKQAKDEALFKPVFDVKLQHSKVSGCSCPHCNQSLVDEEYEGVVVRRGSKMPRIIIRKEKGFSDRIKKLADLTQRDGRIKKSKGMREKVAYVLKCPKCAQKMMRGFYTLAYYIEVDRCNHCNVIWYDRDELEMIQHLIENKKW